VILCGYQSAAAAGTVRAAGPAVSGAAGEGTGWRRRGTPPVGVGAGCNLTAAAPVT